MRLPIFSSFCQELSSAGSHGQDVGLILREEGHRPLPCLSSSATPVPDPSSVPGVGRWLSTNSSWGRDLEGSPNSLLVQRQPPPAWLAVGTDSIAFPETLHAWRPFACSCRGAGRGGTRPRGWSPRWQLQLMAGMPGETRCPLLNGQVGTLAPRADGAFAGMRPAGWAPAADV